MKKNIVTTCLLTVACLRGAEETLLQLQEFPIDHYTEEEVRFMLAVEKKRPKE